MLLDHDGYLPSYVNISSGKKHDVTIAPKIPLSPYSIMTMDRGYNDYSLFAYWTQNHIYFVTRLKDNADNAVVEDRAVPQNRNIVSDQLIEFIKPAFIQIHRMTAKTRIWQGFTAR